MHRVTTTSHRIDCQYLTDGYTKLNHMVASLLALKDELLGSDHRYVEEHVII